MLGVCHQHLYNAAKHLIWQISPAMATRHRGQQTMLHTPWQRDGRRRPEDRVVGLLLVYEERKTRTGWNKRGRCVKCEGEDAVKEGMNSKGQRTTDRLKKIYIQKICNICFLVIPFRLDHTCHTHPINCIKVTEYTSMCTICLQQYSPLFLFIPAHMHKNMNVFSDSHTAQKQEKLAEWAPSPLPPPLKPCAKQQLIYSEGLRQAMRLKSFNEQEIFSLLMLWKHVCMRADTQTGTHTQLLTLKTPANMHAHILTSETFRSNCETDILPDLYYFKLLRL